MDASKPEIYLPVDAMVSPEHPETEHPETEDFEYAMESPQHVSPEYANEISMLECAMIMTRTCERQRAAHFKITPTRDPTLEYIFCCAYTAPTMAVSVMFLQYFGITTLDEYEHKLTDGQIIGPSCTPLTNAAVCNGINEVMGHIWSHHYLHGTGIDVWIQQRYDFFESVLEVGVNLISFVDPAKNKTVHHSLIYISTVNPAICYIIDSWCSDDKCMRDLEMREFETAAVLSVLIQINSVAVDDPSRMMIEFFSDPVPGGSCHSRLQVVKLKKEVILELINTQFPLGCAGISKFGGKKNKRTQKRRYKYTRTHKRKYKYKYKYKNKRLTKCRTN